MVTKVKLCCESAAANVPAKTPTFHLCVTGSTVIPYNQRQKKIHFKCTKLKKVIVKLIFKSCKLVIDIRRAAIVSHRLYCYCQMEPLDIFSLIILHMRKMSLLTLQGKHKSILLPFNFHTEQTKGRNIQFSERLHQITDICCCC